MTQDGDVDQANREVVERFFAASERGDLDELVSLVDDDWAQ
jgi:ketosteroid isomerase-like protein